MPGSGTSEGQVRPVVLVIHGVGHRSESEFRAQVAELESALAVDARFVPVYWGDLLRPDARVDSILPYQMWAQTRFPNRTDAPLSPPADATPSHPTRLADEIVSHWHDRVDYSRHRALGAVYGFVHQRYVQASSQFTGDLIYYHRHREQLWARVWNIIDREAPGAGQPDQPVSVIAHSLGAAIAFEMAVDGPRRLHIDHLNTCATQSPFFHVIGCSPAPLDPEASGEPVTLPPTVKAWTNFYVPLDPWAYLAAPVFTLADGSSPDDIEVRSGNGEDRIVTHLASHYWHHPTVTSTLHASLTAT